MRGGGGDGGAGLDGLGFGLGDELLRVGGRDEAALHHEADEVDGRVGRRSRGQRGGGGCRGGGRDGIGGVAGQNGGRAQRGGDQQGAAAGNGEDVGHRRWL